MGRVKRRGIDQFNWIEGKRVTSIKRNYHEDIDGLWMKNVRRGK